MLHERHVLVSGGVEYDVGTLCLENAFQTYGIANRSDLYVQIQLVVILPQKLLLDGVGIVFVYVQNDKTLGLALGNLAAKLAADRSATARDQHGFACVVRLGGIVIDDERIAEQEVFDVNLAQTATHVGVFLGILAHFLDGVVVHFDLAARLAEEGIQLGGTLGGDVGKRDEDFFDRHSAQMRETLCLAVNLKAEDAGTDLGRVIFDKAQGLVVRAGVERQLLGKTRTDLAGTHDRDADLVHVFGTVGGLFVRTLVLMVELIAETVGQGYEIIACDDVYDLKKSHVTAHGLGKQENDHACQRAENHVRNDDAKIRADVGISPYVSINGQEETSACQH